MSSRDKMISCEYFTASSPQRCLLRCRLLPDLLNTLDLRLLGRKDILCRISVVCIVNAHHLSTLVYMVGSTEHGVHLFQHDALCLGDEEVDEECKQDVDAGKHVEGVETTILLCALVSAMRKTYTI